MSYRLSHEARIDLARIYWRGVEAFGAEQAELYFNRLIQRFDAIAEAPNQYQAVEHIRRGYRRSVCGVDTIYFRLEGEMVEIMRVLGRQDITGEL